MLFPGDSHVSVLRHMINLLGNPSEANWPGYDSLPKILNFEKRLPIQINKLIPNMSLPGAKIVERMLTYDPNQRPTAYEVNTIIYY